MMDSSPKSSRANQGLEALILPNNSGTTIELPCGQTRVLLAVLSLCSQSPTGCTTIREIMHMCDIRSPNGVYQHLRKLRKRGVLTWSADCRRTIRPLVRLECYPEAFARGDLDA